MEPALYLIPVPISEQPFEQVLPSYNRTIITGISFFIVENVRSAIRFLKKLDSALDINTLTFFELNEHTDSADIGTYLEPLVTQKKSIGILSEAGCPAVADPGATIVALAQKQNIRVVPLVGPSSILLALMASGCSGQNFAFNGYLPVKSPERENRLRQLEHRATKEHQTQLFIEAPYRNQKLFAALLTSCQAHTHLCVATGITGAGEYIHTHTIAEWKHKPLPPFDRVPTIFALSQ